MFTRTPGTSARERLVERVADRRGDAERLRDREVQRCRRPGNDQTSRARSAAGVAIIDVDGES